MLSANFVICNFDSLLANLCIRFSIAVASLQNSLQAQSNIMPVFDLICGVCTVHAARRQLT